MSKQLTPKQQYWSDIVANAGDSNLSLADHAKEHQLNPKDLYRWRNRLKSLPVDAVK